METNTVILLGMVGSVFIGSFGIFRYIGNIAITARGNVDTLRTEILLYTDKRVEEMHASYHRNNNQTMAVFAELRRDLKEAGDKLDRLSLEAIRRAEVQQMIGLIEARFSAGLDKIERQTTDAFNRADASREKVFESLSIKIDHLSAKIAGATD